MNEIKLINLANLLKLASLVEMATGLALIVSPSFMALLLLNSELARVGVAIGRVAGFGLFALGPILLAKSTDGGSAPQHRGPCGSIMSLLQSTLLSWA